MTQKKSEFITSIGNSGQLEKLLKGEFFWGHREPRIAVVGRSNVGKSSLLNRLLGSKLVHVSKTPGKTRIISFFKWPDENKILVDLPGYGFAQRSKEEREEWSTLMGDYLAADENLNAILLLMDGRHGPTALDFEAIQYLLSGSAKHAHLICVFTKLDAFKNQKERAAAMKKSVETLSTMIRKEKAQDCVWVSSKSGEGITKLILKLRELTGSEAWQEK